LLVFLEVSVYGRGAYLFELFCYFKGNAEGRSHGDLLHLLPHNHKRGENLPALEPEKRPDLAEGAYDLIGIDAFSFSVGVPLFFRFDFYRLCV
jgi:hypothetical protein